MKVLQGKWWAKAIAMTLCILSILSGLVSLCAMLVSAEYREDTLLDELYGEVADNYSAAVLNWMTSGMSEENFKKHLQTELDPQFQYAIVESEVDSYNVDDPQLLISDIDALNGDKLLYGSKDVIENARYAFKGREDAGYSFQLNSLLGMLRGGYAYYPHDAEADAEEVLRILYAADSRIFYYETESGFYPVRSICVTWDGEQHNYTLTQMAEDTSDLPENETAVTEPLEETAEITTESMQGETDTYPVYLDENGNKLPPYESWDYVQMENSKCAIRYLTNDEATVWDSPGEMVYVIDTIEGMDGLQDYIDTYISNGFLMHKQTKIYTYYYVFSYVDESIDSHGPFVEAKKWGEIFGSLMTYAIVIELLSLIIFVATFLFLICAAGHRSGDDVIHLTMLDKIWLEVFSIGAFLIILAFAALMVYAIECATLNIPGLLVVEAELAFAIGVVVFLYLMSVVSRIKAKRFWRYTGVYWCYRFCARIWKKCFGFVNCIWNGIRGRYRQYKDFYRQHLSLFWRTVLVLTVVTLIGLITFAIFCVEGYYDELYVIWFLMVTLLLWGVVLSVVLQMVRIQEGGRRIAQGDLSEPIDTKGLYWTFKEHAQNINKVSDGIALAVEKQMKSERFKTELITNVSHDIKTPLTSIINYVDLIKKEDIKDETLIEYVDVLDRQSARLKKLIEDLMEASKASTGNLAVNFSECDARVLLTQIVGEFEEKTNASQLEMIVKSPEEPVNVMVDSRHIWRVFDNLLVNICKYAQPGTRVYITLEQIGNDAVITFKNISKYQLNISSEELMERFVRGDSSRNTEGSGLGLNIAQSLTNLMNGTLELAVDGDLFKVILKFPVHK